MIYLGNQAVGVATFNGIPTNIPKIDDNNAYIYLYLPNTDDLSVKIYISASGSGNSFSVDWGDGTTETKVNVSNITHAYSAAGVYRVKLVNISGTTRLGGGGNVWLTGGSSYPERAGAAKLIGLETGTWGIESAEFLNQSSCMALYAKKCPYLAYSTIQVRECRLLKTAELPEISYNLGGYNFNQSFSLTELTIPEGVSAIGSACFGNCGTLALHMEATTPPTLGSSTAFNGTDITIYVPTGALSTYQTAENWSAYADKMVAE